MSLVPLNVLAKKQPPTLRPQCERCGLLHDCNSPKMKPAGQNGRKIMIVGEAPGRQEDRDGKPFVGESGELLRKLLMKCGVDMRADCVITNALICRPHRNEIDDPKKIEMCRPNVIDAIRKYDPNVIIPMGKFAVKSVIGHYYKEDTKGIMRWAGFTIPNHKPNCWICPTAHPAFVLRERDRKGIYKDEGLRERWLLKHLKAAVELSSLKPWKGDPPDYLSKVQVVTDVKEAARMIRKMTTGDYPISFDYECLAPKTKVITDDFRWVEIGTLQVGDTLMAFDENPTISGYYRRLVRSQITAVRRFHAPCVRITLTDGRTVEASVNHPWLAVKKMGRVTEWMTSDRLKEGMLIRQVTTEAWETDNTRDGGWLAGFFDGEGYVTNKTTVGFAQVTGPLFDEAMSLLRKRGFAFGSSEKKRNAFKTNKPQMMGYCKGLQETLRFVGSIRPSRLVKNLQKSIYGVATLPKLNPFATVAKVEPIGTKEVVGITTTTGTFVAEGLCSHNTTCLKPQGTHARIVCASMSDGRTTIVFPWLGEAVKAFKELLESNVPKISHNQRFENAWSEIHLGVKVRGWKWDSMVQAHTIDGRPGIAGLKFQAFVNLGQPDYDSHITSYLRSKKRGGNEPNLIKRVDFKSLAMYCGADSLLTWKLAKIQHKTLDVEFL